MRVLEDLGFYCVDNLPVALAPNVAMLVARTRSRTEGRRARHRSARAPVLSAMAADLRGARRAGLHPEVLFLDASDDVLARRYSESRRPHPMAASGATVAESIRAERLALAEMRERANRVIDTTTLTVHELREVVTAAVMGAASGVADGRSRSFRSATSTACRSGWTWCSTCALFRIRFSSPS